ncbi:hypothetical protein V4F39_03310 [Aquincola sp. MAHUQ-54]|uniref:Uncharacterized protein n=1 Tax=Aquincola agrisoli TaxID=3119538 RepID=A0AAW9QE72_9BURK
MPMCSACHGLEREAHSPAHAALTITDARKRPGGLARGVVFRYRCVACGLVWSRATDTRTLESSWLTQRTA